VWINGSPVTLVGVLEPAFTGPVKTPVSIWAPLASFGDLRMGPAFAVTTQTRVEVIARGDPPVSLRGAEERLRAIVTWSGAAGPTAATRDGGATVALHSAASPIGAGELDTYIVLAITITLVGLVLALACANTANLLMAAAVTRMREVGVRLAMGVTSRRLIRQLVTESALLGLVAGGFGFLFAFWLVPICGAMIQMPPEVDLAPDERVLLFSLAVALLCGVGAGLSPARFAARGSVVATLRSQNSDGAAVGPSRLRTSFIGFQAGVSIFLLVFAALLFRTATVVTRDDIGFDADHVASIYMGVQGRGVDQGAYLQTALEIVRSIPSVEEVSVSEYAPFGYSVAVDRVTQEGRSYALQTFRSDAQLFSTLGLRIVRGRAFTADEVAHEAPVTLISDNVAQTFFKGQDPIGQSLAVVPAVGVGSQEPVTIIGVVAETIMMRLDTQGHGSIYRPLRLKPDNMPSLIIRSANLGAATRAIEDALRPIDNRVRPRTEMIREGADQILGWTRRLAWMLGPIAILALLLAALGVYGVTTFVVGQRMQEVSIRMALGASSADVLRLLVRDSLRPVAMGLAIGLVLALVLARLSAQEIMLAGISPHDPLSISVALLTLLAFAVLAVVVPARKAARTDPAVLLRQA
jgi:putative ABC transport system permease protein